MAYGTYSYAILTPEEAINCIWVMTSAAMIFFMQLGFAFLECGSIRYKNANSILVKNLFDVCVGCCAWWLLGFGFGFGDVNGGFIGTNPAYFACSGLEDLPIDMYISWVFHFAFASTSATIVSGALAERTQLNTYLLFSFF